MIKIKIIHLMYALAAYLLTPQAYAEQPFSAPLKGLIERHTMGTLQTQAAYMQGQGVVLEQIGHGNSFYSLQQGSGNRISAIQHGRGHFADVTQVGTDNTVQLAQYGEAQKIMVQQLGHQASVLIEQY